MRRSCDGWMDGRGGISGMLVELEVMGSLGMGMDG